MTAREYLTQYGVLESRIRDKEEQLRRLRELAHGVVSPIGGGARSSSPHDKIG